MLSLREDPLVELTDYGFLSEPAYFQMGLSSDARCRVRQNVAERLKRARSHLPAGYNFKIWDGYRTTEVQRALYESLYKKLEQERPSLKPKALHAATREFVSPPTEDPDRAAPHNTGGTVDLTVVDEHGRELPMGTGFDHFEASAHTFHFAEAPGGSPEARFHKNRLLLHRALTALDFYNFPFEWWHYSYGDVHWATHHQKPPLYRSCEF